MIVGTNLICNGTNNPMGVDVLEPLFSWRQVGQTAYRLIASASEATIEQDRGDEWDSGRVASEISHNIVWEGRMLKSARRYYWKVKLWDSAAHECPWSPIAWFETGLLNATDWKGRWISAPTPVLKITSQFAPFFRKKFTISGAIASARVYICGLGYFELYVNGCKVGDDVLSPPFTAYDKTCLYFTYDITPMIKQGENIIGALLGNGMYNVIHANAWDFEKAPWRDTPKLIVQTEIRLDNGAEVALASGSSWKVAYCPITSNSIYIGETYDARLEQPGWCGLEVDETQLHNAIICRPPGGRLTSMQMEKIRIVEEFAPASIREVQPGVWVCDFGRNIAGWVRLKLRGQAGRTVTLTYAERLQADGDIDIDHIRKYVSNSSFQQDAYTLKGEGEEVWQPRFTYHGFQYVRVTGYPGTLDFDALTACIVHTDLRTAGGFSCSNDIINKIQAAARAATMYNWHGMPTDCPHREKNGWTGDALLSCEQVLINYHPVNAYKKWLNDIIDCQRYSGQLPGIAPTGGWGYNWGSGPAFDSIIVLLPWNIYLYTGDSSVLQQCWEAIRKYIAFMESMSEDGIADFGLGDWSPPEGDASSAKTPVALSDTWYYHADAIIASKIAAVLGKQQESADYTKLAKTIRQAFLERFVNENTGDVVGACQTSYALALLHGITSGELAGKIFDKLVAEVERCNRHIDCGIIGAKYVLQALSDGGKADLAYAIASQCDFPSWGYWIKQGATTLWETWNGDSSRNHHMFSSVSGFFYKVLAGINPDEAAPGFKHIILEPHPVAGLAFAEGWHDSSYGVVRCAWHRTDCGVNLNVEVPPGTTATLTLPILYEILGVNGFGDKKGKNSVELGAGNHQVVAIMQN